VAHLAHRRRQLELCLLHHLPPASGSPMKWNLSKMHIPPDTKINLFSWRTDVVVPSGDACAGLTITRECCSSMSSLTASRITITSGFLLRPSSLAACTWTSAILTRFVVFVSLMMAPLSSSVFLSNDLHHLLTSPS
jgi:hypothetical protein